MAKAFLLLICLSVFVHSCSFGRKQYGQWTISYKTSGDTLPWARFEWVGDSAGNRFVERYAMNIPAQINGLPHTFTFQFDLGSNLSMLYGENLKPVKAKHPGVNFEKCSIRFGDFIAATPLCYIQKDYGEQIDPGNDKAPRIGTIGSDLFQDKVLIIDYPGQRFCISDTIPLAYKTSMVDIALDKYGRVILPMSLHGKTYKVMFDNGSSMFPLKTSVDKISSFSGERDEDTISVMAWGKPHIVAGRPLKEEIVLAGRHMRDIMVYADHNDEEQASEYDAITGNALFWNKVIVIDFRNRKFGVAGN